MLDVIQMLFEVGLNISQFCCDLSESEVNLHCPNLTTEILTLRILETLRVNSAERVGFEPTVATRATTVFETVPFNRSGTSP